MYDYDDTWHNEKLEKQVPLMPAFDVIGTNCRYFGESQASPQIPLGIISDFDFTKVNPIINSSCLVRKELCQWEPEYDGVEDYDMWLRGFALLSQNGKLIFKKRKILCASRNPTSPSQTRFQ